MLLDFRKENSILCMRYIKIYSISETFWKVVGSLLFPPSFPPSFSDSLSLSLFPSFPLSYSPPPPPPLSFLKGKLLVKGSRKVDNNPACDPYAHVIPKENWTSIWTWAWPVEVRSWMKKSCQDIGSGKAEGYTGLAFSALLSQNLPLLGSGEDMCLQKWCGLL